MARFPPLLLFGVLAVGCLLVVSARRSDKHDLSRLPFDLGPVRWLIGRWRLDRVDGQAVVILPPDVLDFGINPIPLFGARAVNITGHFLDTFHGDRDKQTIYGFMPVKNATRRDPRIHTAFITTFSDGVNLIEQGLVDRRQQTISLHLKQFMKRSFGLDKSDDFYIDRLERQIRVSSTRRGAGGVLTMSIQSETTQGRRVSRDDYTATYVRLCEPTLSTC